MALLRFLIELVSAQRMINARFIRPSARQALLLCMLAMGGIAQALAATNLSPSPATDHVATRMLLMAEPYAGVSAGSMAAQPPSAWSQLHDPVLNFSFDDQAYWLRIEISNPLPTPYSLVADLGQPCRPRSGLRDSRYRSLQGTQ